MCMASVATRWYNMIKRTKIFPQSCSSSIFSGWRGLNCKWILVSSQTPNIHRYATNLNVNLSSEQDRKSNVYHNPVLEQPSHNVFATADWNKSRTSCQRPAFSPALTWQLCNCAAEQHPQITQNLWNQLNLSKWSNCLASYPPQFSRAMTYDMHWHAIFSLPLFFWGSHYPILSDSWKTDWKTCVDMRPSKGPPSMPLGHSGIECDHTLSHPGPHYSAMSALKKAFVWHMSSSGPRKFDIINPKGYHIQSNNIPKIRRRS